MSPSSEVREFLVSRRARITPEQAGLLAYGRNLDLTFEAFDLPSEPGPTLAVYTAEPDTPTAEALGFLASWAAAQQAEADSRR